MRVLALLVLVVFGFVVSPLAQAQGERFVVISHPSSGKADAVTLRDLYLKRRTQWPSGVEARPVRAKAGASSQQAFRTQILGMTEAELTRHWLSVKQRTGQTPPTEARSPRAILLLVKRIPGAFGVVELSSVPDDGSVAVVMDVTP